ncbi:UDP-phosphate galactose phosphotransferase [Haloferula helveola]|uniref:UDP-phosphate galactose phosphotransferase n=1 Tax=Haloferula helveola TaxID=490095 RepID=A0ABN6H3U8_9BACT|nr:UDP-phosphate galactose phosphotransferase [Haloferula helveola]
MLQLVDAALVWASFYLADFVRNPLRELIGQQPVETGNLAEMTWVLYVAVPFTPLVLEFLGFYRRLRSKTFGSSFSQLIRGLLIMALMLGMLAVFARLPDTSRLILGLGGFFVLLLLLARDRMVTAHLKHRGIRQDLKERVLIAASADDVDAFLDELDPEAVEAMNIVGEFDLDTQSVGDLYDILKESSVERVIISAGDIGFAKVAECVEACELQGVETWVAASFMRTQVARPTFDVIGDKPMLVLRSTPDLSWELAVKSVFDRVGAFVLILLTFPLWVFAWVGIRIASPGPAFFFQKRAGKYGKPFRMWKFRTMVPNAEEMLKQIKEDHGNQMEGPVFKLENDPRIFKFGAILRKLSIDEFPQLINVLMGDMSLVGPRPLPLYEVEAFQKSEHRRRLSVKPGITCEWQAGGRNTITSFEQWVEMDLRYIDNWSLWLDIKLLLKTIPAVLFGKGAK